jgi:isocitrate dehydrogenase kinase/phosphatase
MSAEPWYSVAANDIFPEEFTTFLLGPGRARDLFLEYNRDVVTAEFWQEMQRRVREGIPGDLFPYPQDMRFENRWAGGGPHRLGQAAAG